VCSHCAESERALAIYRSFGDSGVIAAGGDWVGPDRVYAFEDLGRRIAPSVGGFPIKVRLTDAHGGVQREITVGRLTVGAKDELYYFGSATKADAEALAQALGHVGCNRAVGIRHHHVRTMPQHQAFSCRHTQVREPQSLPVPSGFHAPAFPGQTATNLSRGFFAMPPVRRQVRLEPIRHSLQFFRDLLQGIHRLIFETRWKGFTSR